MAERISASILLRQAAAIFDAPANQLAKSARRACRGGFASGGCWMQLALEHLRGQPLAGPASDLNYLGLLKYGLACAAALAWLLLTIQCQLPLLAVLAVPVFYAVEAQMVFLFPLALDGSIRPFREARRWTRRAGGTLNVMRIVLPLALTMLSGGFLRRGFVRSWCLGCLAVCLWYEHLRRLSDANLVYAAHHHGSGDVGRPASSSAEPRIRVRRFGPARRTPRTFYLANSTSGPSPLRQRSSSGALVDRAYPRTSHCPRPTDLSRSHFAGGRSGRSCRGSRVDAFPAG